MIRLLESCAAAIIHMSLCVRAYVNRKLPDLDAVTRAVCYGATARCIRDKCSINTGKQPGYQQQ